VKARRHERGKISKGQLHRADVVAVFIELKCNGEERMIEANIYSCKCAEFFLLFIRGGLEVSRF